MIKRIALIPARGGSKRLPKKNILPLQGKPLLTWTIEAAMNSSIFSEISVSTDDDEIAQIAIKAGATVLRREEYLSNDVATVAQVCYFHLKEYERKKQHYDQLFCLYPTAPLRKSEDLQRIADIFDDEPDAQAIVAVTDYSHYPYQALAINNAGKLTPFWPDLVNLRSSDLPRLVAGNGSTYAITVQAFLQHQNFYLPQGMYAYYMDPIRSIDIDNESDYRLLQVCATLF